MKYSVEIEGRVQASEGHIASTVWVEYKVEIEGRVQQAREGRGQMCTQRPLPVT